MGSVGVTGNYRFGVYPNFLTQSEVFITSTHTHTNYSPVAINTELHRFEFLLMMLLVHATKVMIEALHAWAQSQNRIVVYFRSDDNGGRETTILDEIRTSAWGKIKLQ